MLIQQLAWRSKTASSSLKTLKDSKTRATIPLNVKPKFHTPNVDDCNDDISHMWAQNKAITSFEQVSNSFKLRWQQTS